MKHEHFLECYNTNKEEIQNKWNNLEQVEIM